MPRLTDREERAAVAHRFKVARKAAGYRNADLSRVLQVASSRITAWENGDALPNTPRLWRRLAEATGVSTDYTLLGKTDGLARSTCLELTAVEAEKPQLPETVRKPEPPPCAVPLEDEAG